MNNIIMQKSIFIFLIFFTNFLCAQQDDGRVPPVDTLQCDNGCDISVYPDCDCTTENTPSIIPVKKFIVSGWVKEDHTAEKVSYNDSAIQVGYYVVEYDEVEEEFVQISDNVVMPSSSIFYPSGAIIDGWQRIVGIVEVPENIFTIIVKLKNTGDLGVDSYFDDIRIYPYNGTLKSFVYDEETQRLMAELDENNYATYYEYDQEGGLVRVKKETERGVYTIQETRSSTVKSE